MGNRLFTVLLGNLTHCYGQCFNHHKTLIGAFALWMAVSFSCFRIGFQKSLYVGVIYVVNMFPCLMLEETFLTLSIFTQKSNFALS